MITSGLDRESSQTETTTAPAPATKKPVAIVPALRNGAVVAGISLVLLEIALRFLGLANPVLYERDPDVGYRLKPGQRVSYLTNKIVINAYGVRDPRTLDALEPGKRRVVCLGDSVTWGGIYVRQEELFTSIAERELGDIEVINAGVNGYSTTQMAHLYDKYLTGLNPDLVVFCVLLRDFDRPPVVELSGDSVAFPEERPSVALVAALKICQLSVYNRFQWTWLRPPQAVVQIDDWNVPGRGTNVDAIAELIRKFDGNPKAMVVVIPVEHRDNRWRSRLNYLRSLRNLGVRTTGLGTVRAALVSSDFVDNVHLSTSGHRKIGAALAALLYEEMESGNGIRAEPEKTR